MPVPRSAPQQYGRLVFALRRSKNLPLIDAVQLGTARGYRRTWAMPVLDGLIAANRRSNCLWRLTLSTQALPRWSIGHVRQPCFANPNLPSRQLQRRFLVARRTSESRALRSDAKIQNDPVALGKRRRKTARRSHLARLLARTATYTPRFAPFVCRSRKPRHRELLARGPVCVTGWSGARMAECIPRRSHRASSCTT